MADQEELDEDLFADLYEGDDAPSKPGPVAPAPKSEEPETVISEPVEPIPEATLNIQPTEASIANGAGGGFSAQAEPIGDDIDMSGGGWNGEANQPQEDAGYAPINVKEDGKMFIGGLNWETTEQSLKEYFSQFGEVSECTVMRDSTSGRSRGFGFLTFKDPKCVNIVMVKEHYLDGKIIDPKRAIPREEQERTSKIFVGGVSQEATEHDFTEFFKTFGNVVDATLMMDKDTGRPRGFGFVTFDSDTAVDRTLAGPLQILGKPIEVKRAQPRGNMREGEDDKKFGARGGKFPSQPGQQGNFDAQQSQNPQATGNQQMSPAMMAQYWQRMQLYFQNMQQQLAQNQTMPNMGGMGGQMNPAMMQQMMMMNGMNRPQSGSPHPQSPNSMSQMNQMGPMNPAMMQQMQQMQQMPQQGQGGYDQNQMMGINRPGFNAQEQQAFEQQKYEQQQAARRMQAGGGYGGQGGPTSWDGMYDDTPQPTMPPQGPAGQRNNQNFRGGHHGRGRQSSQQPSTQPSNAPANAPTGPKNAGKPGANYRGGGRGGRGFRVDPYGRG